MMTALYATVGGKEQILSLGDAGMTVVIGLIVVFGALILLTLVFYLFGWIMAPKKNQSAVATAAPVVAPATAMPAVSAADDECEIAAVIAAAVAAMAPEGVVYEVQDFAPAAASVPTAVPTTVGYAPRRRRSAWSASGLAQNVAPF